MLCNHGPTDVMILGRSSFSALGRINDLTLHTNMDLTFYIGPLKIQDLSS